MFILPPQIRTPNKLSEDENALFMVLAEVNKDTENGTIDGMIQRDDGEGVYKRPDRG